MKKFNSNLNWKEGLVSLWEKTMSNFVKSSIKNGLEVFSNSQCQHSVFQQDSALPCFGRSMMWSELPADCCDAVTELKFGSE